jgi:membrane protein insertase Oxa1/YidC/SpoIIIJ
MELFTTLIYQPFFNLLVGVYWFLGVVAPQYQDMGNAVIIFSIIFRIVWLPITISASQSAKERHEISEKITKAQEKFSKDPIKQKEAIDQIMHNNRRTVVISAINLFLSALMMYMLYQIFTTGLEGADFHLIYDWMPPPPQHFNLTFLNQFDLTKPNWTLNIVNALIIFIVELMGGWLSPFPTGRTELMTLFILPIGALTFFAFMPSGKKLFVITTLLFSIGIMSIKIIKMLIFESRSRIRKVAYGLILDKK